MINSWTFVLTSEIPNSFIKEEMINLNFKLSGVRSSKITFIMEVNKINEPFINLNCYLDYDSAPPGNRLNKRFSTTFN